MDIKRHVLFTFLLTCHLLSAQEVPRIHTFLSNDYNALPQNWSIVQDCEGYIFAANTEGILIYNGYKWTLLKLARNNRPRSVFLGNDCRVYVTGYEFFGYINFQNKSAPQYIPVADSILENSNQEFWNIFGTKEEIIFQSFSDVYIYDYSKLKKIVPPTNVMLGNAVGNKLFLPKIEHGIYQIQDKEVFLLEGTNQLPLRSKVVNVCKGNAENQFVIATQYDGLYIYNSGSLRAIESPLNDRLKKEQINKMIRTTSGSYIIGTILNGLHITDDLNNPSLNINKSNGLSNNTVLSILEDENHNLWIGLDKGINFIELNNPTRYFYDKKGELGNVFTSIWSDGALYIGSNQGVFRKDVNHNFQLIPNSQGQVWSFLETEGDLICGHNSGSYLIKDGQFTKISDITGGWATRVLGPQMIIQSTYTGLITLEKKNQKWGLKSRIANGDLLIMDFEIDGHMIVGYHPFYGICVLELSADKETIIDRRILESIGGHEINDEVQITKSKKGIIIELDDQLFILKNKTFFPIESKDRSVFNTDELWTSQFNYINAISNLATETNITNLRFNKPRDNVNNFLYGSNDGYVIVPNRKNGLKNKSFTPTIDYIKVNNQFIDTTVTKELKFKANENDITFQLRNISSSFIKNDYYFQLENWDAQWYQIPKDGTINFFNLQNEKYTLFVSSDKEKRDAICTFEIKPHWYESWPGIILYLIISSLVFIFLNRRQKKKWLKKEKELKAQKEKEIESERIKASYIQLEREVKYKNKMLANSTMTLVQKNKMLIDLKNKIAKETSAESLQKTGRQKLMHLIDKNINSDHDWEIFERTFAEVHEDFLEKLKQNNPALSSGDLRLAAYIRMNLSSKEIAPLMNISLRSIENKRYRLRKKLGIPHDSNLKEYLFNVE